MRVPIFEVSTNKKTLGKTKRIGYLVESPTGIVTDPPQNQILASILEIDVLTIVDGEPVHYTSSEHPREWLTYLSHEVRNYIFAGQIELTPGEANQPTEGGN